MKILVAIGGNAILRRGGTGTVGEQFAVVDQAAKELVKLIKAGHALAITHGNGPQIGDILLAYDSAKGVLPPMPLDICGAQSQGMIGYMLQQSLERQMHAAGVGGKVATVLTQTVVSESDPAFQRPSKPIGPFYGEAEAEKLRVERGWVVAEDSNRGFRRIVPSPEPVAFVEGDVIKEIYEGGTVVIAAGGGGVPVVPRKGYDGYVGVEAVIDKDLAAALLAKGLGVDLLVILTDVEGVFIDYGKPGQKLLRRASVKELRDHLRSGQFPPGSMGPKVQAAIRFTEARGKRAVITSLGKLEAAVSGGAGTEVYMSLRDELLD